MAAAFELELPEDMFVDHESSVLARCRVKAAPEITGSHSYVMELLFICSQRRLRTINIPRIPKKDAHATVGIMHTYVALLDP